MKLMRIETVVDIESGAAMEVRHPVLEFVPDTPINIKPDFVIAIPFPCKTPRGQIQMVAEIQIDAEDVVEAFKAAPTQIPQKMPAAQALAVKRFEDQQRAAALRDIPALPPGFFRGAGT